MPRRTDVVLGGESLTGVHARQSSAAGFNPSSLGARSAAPMAITPTWPFGQACRRSSSSPTAPTSPGRERADVHPPLYRPGGLGLRRGPDRLLDGGAIGPGGAPHRRGRRNLRRAAFRLGGLLDEEVIPRELRLEGWTGFGTPTGRAQPTRPCGPPTSRSRSTTVARSAPTTRRATSSSAGRVGDRRARCRSRRRPRRPRPRD